MPERFPVVVTGIRRPGLGHRAALGVLEGAAHAAAVIADGAACGNSRDSVPDAGTSQRGL